MCYLIAKKFDEKGGINIYKYIFTNIKTKESSVIKAEDEEDATIKMVEKHKNMGLGATTYEGIKKYYEISRI